MEMTLAENIRSFRKQRSLTQEQLAEALGVTPGAVYKWEARLSVPEVPMLMALADFFDASVDALLGYRIRNNSLAAIAERLNECCRTGDPAALSEAEKVLKKYPNSFMIVYGCAQIFHVFGAEERSRESLRRALELYERSLLLMAQNTDPNVSETTVYGSMGTVYVLMGEPEKGVEILKKHNAGGMFDDAIADTLLLFLHRPEEARPFLFDALLRIVSSLQSVAMGYATLYGSRGDFRAEQEAAAWGLEMLRGLRRDGGASYLDRVAAVMTVLLAHAQLHSGDRAAARATLRKAAALARAFDAAPNYGAAGVRFSEGSETGSLHDGMGRTAEDSAAFLLEQLGDGELSAMWKDAACPEEGDE